MKKRKYIMGGQEVSHPIESVMQAGFDYLDDVEHDQVGLSTSRYKNKDGQEISVTKIINKPNPNIALLIHGLSVAPELFLLHELSNNDREQVIGVEKFDPERANMVRIKRLFGDHALAFIRQATKY